MSLPLLVLRPEPGASATGRRAEALGLRAVVAPLFAVQPLAWTAPDAAGFDALIMTSANAARHGGAQLARYRHLPLFAVGGATAAAARKAGFHDVTEGSGDAAALLALMAIRPPRRALHLCGAHRRETSGADFPIVQVAVYTAVGAEAFPPPAEEALRAPAAVLLHSPRAAALFGALLDRARASPKKIVSRAGVAIVAISEETRAAAGPGWRIAAAAPAPSETAMLAIARILCEDMAS